MKLLLDQNLSHRRENYDSINAMNEDANTGILELF